MPHQAAFLPCKKGQMQVGSVEYTQPKENEIVVRNAAVAINPLDWFKQGSGNLFAPWIKYPFVLGSDLAGQVVEVGPGVSRFKVGDRVIGHAVGMDERSNKSSEGAFQEYTVVRTSLASPIPDNLSYEAACVLPLGVSTASCGLFLKDYLALRYPTTSTPELPTGADREMLLVWGGSTSVGCNAIQLATAAGYDVVTTASPRNHESVKQLGATAVFDYNSPTVIEDILAVFHGRVTVGAFAIGRGSLAQCMNVLARCRQGRKFVAQASVDLPSSGFPQGILDWPAFGLQMGVSMASLKLKGKLRQVQAKFIWGSDNMANELGQVIYDEFLPQALRDGRFVAAPEPHVVGKGLEHIQEAMDLNRKGVSMKKVVVTL